MGNAPVRSKRAPRRAPQTGPDKALAFLARLASEFTMVLSLPDLLEHVLRVLREDTGFDSCAIALLGDDAPHQFVIRAASGLQRVYLGLVVPSTKGVYGDVYASGVPRRVAEMQGEVRTFHHGPIVRSGIYTPLTVRGRTIGVLSAHRREPDAFTDGDLNLLTVVARYLAGAIEVANLHEQLKALAATDALTGLANRRLFLDRLTLEIKRVRRTGGGLVVAILDLNGFKRVNDTMGHAAGDRTLVTVALHLSKQIRGTDLVARFGGDEFMLLLPNTTHTQAERVLDRLGAAAISVPDETGGRIPLGFSWGIAAWPEDGDDPETLIGEADARLYVMKQRL